VCLLLTRCGKQLDAAMAAAGAVQAVARSDVNKEDWPVVNRWLDAVCEVVLAAPLKTVAQMGGISSDSNQKAATKRWGKSRPYYAHVAAVEGLCHVSSKADKDTVRVEFDLGDSGLEYLPGDALGIYATNAVEVSTRGYCCCSAPLLLCGWYQQQFMWILGSIAMHQCHLA
jgi:sulfite reductase (NADPH) flavoprotein alpha-component